MFYDLEDAIHCFVRECGIPEDNIEYHFNMWLDDMCMLENNDNIFINKYYEISDEIIMQIIQ